MRFFLVALLILVSACVKQTKAVSVEDLVIDSSETVKFPIGDNNSINYIEDWVKKDKPVRSIVSCGKNRLVCNTVKKILSSREIPFDTLASNKQQGSVSLLYKRVNARSCMKEFGCSVSVNIIQSVTDRLDFISPELSDYQDADGAIKAIGKYK
jgi:hypothetical protein